MIKQDMNQLIYSFDSELLILEPWGTDSIRVRSTKQPFMQNQDWALIPQKKPKDMEIIIDKSGGKLRNGKLTVWINYRGKLKFFNQKNELLLEEYVRNKIDYQPGEDIGLRDDIASSLQIAAREHRPIIGGDFSITARFEPKKNEKIYGMGQYQHGLLNLKGTELELAQRNSQASIPFMISSSGYGFLWNNPAIGRVSFATNITTWYSSSSDTLDYWITAGDKPADIMKNYTQVTGHVPMMSKTAMGFWQSKLRYQTQEELLGVAREYKRRNLPISVIVCDYFHWTMQGEWKFDLDYWPDPEGMIKELKDMGIELMVSIWPTVDHNSENYKEMLEKGYLIHTERGFRVALVRYGNTTHFDFTNPYACKYFWKKIKKNYYNKGIRIFWLDEAEPDYSVYDFDNYRYYLGPNVKIGNIYPIMYAKTFYEGMEQEGQKNIINLVRCAWAGSQRYGALVWSGDIGTSFRNLREQLAAGLNTGLAGIPWWTTDIGGFHGGNPEDPEYREVMIRWFQFGTFCPVMRLHGNRDPQKKPLGTKGGGVCNSGAANEVWSYGEEVYEVCKKYLFLRERMKDYITSLMDAAHKFGEPIIRPLFYDFYNDKNVWEIEDVYMFGPDVLVAPVMEKGVRKKNVYLPKEKKWTEMETGRVYDGGQQIIVNAPIDCIPVFLTNGRKFD